MYSKWVQRMKRLHQCLFLLLLLAALLLLCACIAEVPHSHSSDIFDPPDFEPTPAPSSWATIQYGYDVHHVRNESVAIETVPARRIGLPDDAGVVKPMPDGGCLYISAIQTGEAEPERMAPHCLHVIRFDADGSVVLSRTYGELPFFGYLISVCVFEDGGFAAYLQIDADGTEPFESEGLLCRFDANDAPVFQKAGIPTEGRIFAAPDGAVILAGITETTHADGSWTRDIALCRYAPDGSIQKQANLNVEGFRSLLHASYDPGAGLVLVWQDPSGDFSHIASFDADFTVSWESNMPVGQRLYEVSALPGGGALVIGATDTGTSSVRDALFHFNAAGENDWIYAVPDTSEHLVIGIAEELSNGKYVAGLRYHKDSGGTEQYTDFVVLSQTGEVEATLEPLHGHVWDIVPCSDGGFIAVLCQSVRTLPQPPQISSIWMDTEAVVVRYDADFNVIWLRTVDQYKYEKRNDIIVVTSDGKLLIG